VNDGTLDFAIHLRDHLTLCCAALAVALAGGLPLGSWLSHSGRAREPVLGAIVTARVIPSLAVLAFMLPILGIGFAPALAALVLLAIPPIAINTDIGMRTVGAAVRDAARGLGMSEAQIRRRIDWPLALPIVIAGVRTATVEVIASATLAAFIGGGGLGEFIVNGLAANDLTELLEGALGVAALAVAAEWALSRAQVFATRTRKAAA
jgi:osmoprotectant transport system permease protein